MAEWGPRNRAPEHRQLLAERQVLKRDCAVSAADQCERSEHDDERGQHALSCRATDHRINRLGWRSNSGEGQADALLWLRLPLHAVLVWWTWKVATSSAGPRVQSSVVTN
jgi:hypothetical protein